MKTREKTENKVVQYIEKHKMLMKNDTVVVGLSGGADSVCLFHLLLGIRDRLGFSMVCVHVHHGIRGVSADTDEAYVKALCERHQIVLRVFHEDIPAYAQKKGLSLEEAGRIVRYQRFLQVSSEYQQAKIAVAHHRNDQAETMLFQLLRGSGLKGLGGMQPVRENIIRPLLCLKREEIEEYLSFLQVSYCVDETNHESDYSRNMIRNQVLPVLTKMQPRCIEHMSDACEDFYLADDFLKELALDFLKQYAKPEHDRIVIPIRELREQKLIIKRYIIREAMKTQLREWKDMTRVHIEDVISLIEKSSGKQIVLPKGLLAFKTGEQLVIGFRESKEKTAFPCREVSIGKQMLLYGDAVLQTELIEKGKFTNIDFSTYTKWFDYDKIKGGLFVRTRRQSDYLCINQAMSKKKLKEYFINEKIPREERDQILLLADEEAVLWVIGHRISEQYKVTDETKHILKVQITGGTNHE